MNRYALHKNNTSLVVLSCSQNGQAQTITPLYPAQGYLDLVLDSGFKHLAWFAHASDSRPKLLTQGKYEVTEVVSVDKEQQRM